MKYLVLHQKLFIVCADCARRLIMTSWHYSARPFPFSNRLKMLTSTCFRRHGTKHWNSRLIYSTSRGTKNARTCDQFPRNIADFFFTSNGHFITPLDLWRQNETRNTIPIIDVEVDNKLASKFVTSLSDVEIYGTSTNFFFVKIGRFADFRALRTSPMADGDKPEPEIEWQSSNMTSSVARCQNSSHRSHTWGVFEVAPTFLSNIAAFLYIQRPFCNTARLMAAKRNRKYYLHHRCGAGQWGGIEICDITYGCGDLRN